MRTGKVKKAPDRFPRPGHKGLIPLPGGKTLVGDYIGIDEVGVGALAGPMVFCAIAIKTGVVDGVRDSKKIGEEFRYPLAEALKQAAIAWKIVEISPQYIDKNGYAASWDKGS